MRQKEARTLKINKNTYCIEFLIFFRFTFSHFPSPSSSWFCLVFVYYSRHIASPPMTALRNAKRMVRSADNQVWVQRERLSYLTTRKDFGRMFQVTKFPLLELNFFFNNVRLIGAARRWKLRYWKWISLVVRWHRVVFVYTYHGTCALQHTLCQIWHQSCRRRVSLPLWNIIYYYIIAPRVMIKAIIIIKIWNPRKILFWKIIQPKSSIEFFYLFVCC